MVLAAEEELELQVLSPRLVDWVLKVGTDLEEEEVVVAK